MAAWSRQSHLLSSGVPQSLPVRTCIAPTTSDTAAADAEAPGEYFDYCIDDLGLQDMRAADAKIRELADAELGPRQAALWFLEPSLDCSVTVCYIGSFVVLQCPGPVSCGSLCAPVMCPAPA